jgi:hypothetical protein
MLAGCPVLVAALLVAPPVRPEQKDRPLAVPAIKDDSNDTALQKAQAEVKKLRAEMASMQGEVKTLRDEARRRRQSDQWTEEEIQGLIEEAVERDPRARRLRQQLAEREVEVADYRDRGFSRDYYNYRIARERAAAARRQFNARREVLAARIRRQSKERPRLIRDEELHQKVDRLQQEVEQLRRQLQQK